MTPDHPLFPGVIDDMAGYLLAEGRPEEAEPLLRRALDLSERRHGRVSRSYGRRLAQLARMLASVGRQDEAEALRQEAHAIRNAMRG